MDAHTIDKKVTDSKPLKYVSYGGIVLAIIAFLYMVFLFFKFLFGLGAHAFAVAGASISGSATSTASGFFSLPVIPADTGTSTTSSGVHVNYGHANYVYGIPVGSH